MGAIRKIRKNLDQSTALSLYKCLVLPHIDHCDIKYDSASQKNLQKLQLLQNCPCRAILLANFDTHIVDMHQSLNLLMLKQCRNLHMSVTCHKSVYFSGESSLLNFYVAVLQVHGRNTRYADSNKMQIPRTHTDIGQKGLFSPRP